MANTMQQGAARAMMAVLIATASGCLVTGDARRERYQRCDPATTDYCVGGTSCEVANATTDPTMTSAGGFCSYPCSSASGCPSSPSGATVGCFVQSGAATGFCYEACPSGRNTDCPTGFQCSTLTGSDAFCVPYGAY